MRELLETPVTYCVLGIALALFQPIRAGWSGLLVLGFLIVLYAFLAKGERTGQRYAVGDNCYIIGFIYTLSIITLSLVMDAEELLGSAQTPTVPEAVSGGAPELPGPQLHPLLKTIGIALGTSVIGMVCRFLLTHGIEVSEDAFDRTVERTAIASAKLEGVAVRLGSASTEVESAMGKAVSAISAYADAVEEESASVGKSLASTAGRMLDQHQQKVDATLRALGASTAALSRRMDEEWADIVGGTRDTLNAASKAISAHTVRLEAEVESIGVTVNRVAADMVEDLRQKVADVLQANRFDDVRDALTQAGDVYRDAAQKLARTMADSVGELDARVGRAVDEHAKASGEIRALLLEALADLRTQVGEAEGSAKDVRALVASMQEHGNAGTLPRMYEAMERFAARVEAASDVLDAAAARQSTVAEAVEGQLNHAREAHRMSEALVREIGSDVDAIASVKERYREEFDRAATAALAETHRLYSRLIGGAAMALSGIDDLEAFARDLRVVAKHVEDVGDVRVATRDGR